VQANAKIKLFFIIVYNLEVADLLSDSIEACLVIHLARFLGMLSYELFDDLSKIMQKIRFFYFY